MRGVIFSHFCQRQGIVYSGKKPFCILRLTDYSCYLPRWPFICRGLSSVNNRCDPPIQSSRTRQYCSRAKMKFNFKLHCLLFISVPVSKGCHVIDRNSLFSQPFVKLAVYCVLICCVVRHLFVSNPNKVLLSSWLHRSLQLIIALFPDKIHLSQHL